MHSRRHINVGRCTKFSRLVERQADAGRRWKGRQKQTGRQKKVQRQVEKVSRQAVTGG